MDAVDDEVQVPLPPPPPGSRKRPLGDVDVTSIHKARRRFRENQNLGGGERTRIVAEYITGYIVIYILAYVERLSLDDVEFFEHDFLDDAYDHASTFDSGFEDMVKDVRVELQLENNDRFKGFFDINPVNAMELAVIYLKDRGYDCDIRRSLDSGIICIHVNNTWKNGE